MNKKRNYKNILIICLVLTLFFLSIAYSAFSSNLKINGITKILSQGTWDIAFEKINSFKINGYATGSSNKSITEKSITFNCEFVAEGDSCSISTNIINKGTIDAIFKGYEYVISENDEEVYRGMDSEFVDETITVEFINNFHIDENFVSGDKKEVGVTITLKPSARISGMDKYTIKVNYKFEQVPKE